MEHLIVGGTEIPLRVPYLAHEYDHGDFLTWPDRQGWDVTRYDRYLIDGDEDIDLLQGNQTWADLAALLQTWLFFGLLHTALAGMLIEQSEYKRFDASGPLLTTTLLSQHLAESQKSWALLDEIDRTAKRKHLVVCLRKATSINNNFNYFFHYGDSRPGSEVIQQTVIAQCLLEEVLVSLCLKPEDLENWDFNYFGRDVYLRQSLLDAGWCPWNIEYMQANLTTQVQTYALAMGSVRNQHDHSECGEHTGCTSLRAGTDFQARHVENDCQCEMLSAPVKEIIRLLQDGLIPVITVSTADADTIELLVEGISLEESAYELHCPYLTLSHVWADGLGNSLANALPICQLKRIRNILASIKTEIKDSPIEVWTARYETTAYSHDTLAFWMDTLCIPVEPQHQALRDFSISKMRQIYERAAGVLALDPDLLRLPASARPADIMVATLCSGWRSRLWTYQEAALARNLYLALDGSCFEFDHGIAEDLKQTFLDVAGGDIMQGQLLLSAWKPYRKFVWDNFGGFLTTRNSARALYRMAISASFRNTSRGGDETVCLATFLNLDATPLLNVKEDDRMAAFLSILPDIPPEILFSHGEHLGHKGFRWAPKSFLLPNYIPAMYDIVYPKEYTPPGQQQACPVPPPSLHSSGLGLKLFLSSVKFSCVEIHASRMFLVETPGRGTWEVEVRDTSASNPWPPAGPPRPRTTLLILLMNLEYCDLGIIAGVSEDDGRSDVSACHWLGVVEVYEPEDRGRWTLQEGHPVTYAGEHLDFQEWIID